VALASAHNISGYRIDVEAIGTLCAERDVLFSLDDAIQTLGAFPIPLNHVDFLSAGAQKWMLVHRVLEFFLSKAIGAACSDL